MGSAFHVSLNEAEDMLDVGTSAFEIYPGYMVTLQLGMRVHQATEGLQSLPLEDRYCMPWQNLGKAGSYPCIVEAAGTRGRLPRRP